MRGAIPRRDALLVALVAGLALALRLGHLAAFRALAFYRLPFGDSRSFVEEAARILAAGPLADGPPYFQGPLYPLWLALVQALGGGLSAVYAIQCVTGTLTVVLVMLLARRLVSMTAALVAGLLYATYDAAIFFDVELLAASIVATLVVLGLWLLPIETPGSRAVHTWRAGLAGAALALAAWGRPNLALALVALVVWALAGWRDAERRTRLTFVVAGGVLLLLPLGRNLATSGEPVFISSGGGVNFYIGNHRGAPGTFSVPPVSGLANDRDLGTLSRVVASRAEQRELSAGAASAYWLRRGMSDLLADPLAAGRLYARKLALLVSHREIPNHLDLEFVRAYSPVLRFVPTRAALLLALGAAGILLLAPRSAARPILVFAGAAAASVLPFFVTARYRLPLMPILAVLAGGFAARAWRWRVIAAGERRALTRGVIVGLFVLGLSFLPLLPRPTFVEAHVNLGALHADLGEMDAAEAELGRALDADPDDPRALENLGVLALRRDDPATALGWLEHSLDVAPRAFSAWNLRGVALAQLGRYDEALASIERALAIFPDWPDATANLAATWRVYLRRAMAAAREAGIPSPTDPADLDRLISYLKSIGYDRAAERIRRTGPPGAGN